MLDKLADFLLYLPRKIFSWFVDALVYLFQSIPVPDFVSNLNFSGLSSLSYFLDVTAFYWGLGMMFSALIARFLLRRIPFIGG